MNTEKIVVGNFSIERDVYGIIRIWPLIYNESGGLLEKHKEEEIKIDKSI